MALSNNLISQFAKSINNKETPVKETIVYGEVKEVQNGTPSKVLIDGASENTPVTSTVKAEVGNRVIITIKNHHAIITGNMGSPAVIEQNVAGMQSDIDTAKNTADNAATKVAQYDQIIAEKATAKELAVERSRINTLESDNVTIRQRLETNEADIGNLEAEYVKVNGALDAHTADIEELNNKKLNTEQANITYAKISSLDATNANVSNLSGDHAAFKNTTTERLDAVDGEIKDLKTDRLTVTSADVRYANIDFANISEAAIKRILSDTGLIKNIIVGDGTITGKLVGVTISGDLIEGNTVKAEKLVVKGSDGLYYKLNVSAGATTTDEISEDDLQNGLHGSVIIAKSIAAEKIDVKDLVAFDATIGGFNINSGSIYSGSKNSPSNTTRGTYLGSDGQVVFGDSVNYVKYYKDQNGNYKVDISASSIILSSSNKNVETAINEVQDSVDSIEIGGRNILLNSKTKILIRHGEATLTHEHGIEVPEWTATDAIRVYGSGGTAQIFGTLSGTSCHMAADTNKQYALSIYIKNNHATNSVIVSGNHISSAFITVEPQELKRVEIAGPGNGWGFPQINFRTVNAGDEFDFVYWHPKLEFGNKPTDWSPAPEDMATSEEVDAAQNMANSADSKASNAETLIKQLSDSISMLVTDGNGSSLMTQTEDGWTFSTAEIQTIINNTSENLNTLVEEVGDTNQAVDILQQAVSDLGKIAEYVKITTYQDEPCIELGEGDSEFKLRITNTRMMFTEGSNVLAYFNNQSLHIKKAVVEEELQQGGFVWKARNNGNMGLVWKGGNS